MEENVKIERGIAWSAVEKISYQGIQFLMTIIISRFVLPEEYGLVAMLGIFIAVSNSIIDCGFSSALIQKQDRTEEDFSTAFYTNLVFGLVIYIILYLCSPYIANFYHEPRLVFLTRIICLTLLLRSLGIVQNAKLVIALDFKTLSKASLSSAFLSGVVGSFLAYYKYGVWAVVTQSVLGALVTTFLLWLFSKWKPSFNFSKESFKNLFGFGSKLMISGLMHTIYLNLYTMVIGKFYNATDVGYYNRASTLSQYPSTSIVGILNRVFFPVLCSKQEDSNSFSDTFHSYLRVSCFIIFPISIAIASFAQPLIIFLLTERWEGTIIPVQILAIAYMFYPVLLINNQPLQALNHTTMFFYAEVIKKIIAILLLFAAVNYGLIILCLSVLVYNICDTIIILCFTRTIMETSFKRQLRELSRILIASSIMGGVSFAFVKLSPFGDILTLLLDVTFCTILYCSLCWILRIKELKITINAIKGIWLK